MSHTYNIPLVLSTADRIESDGATLCYVGTLLAKDNFEGFVQQIAKRLPSNVPREILRKSLQYLAGTELTARELSDLAWRLAGNVSRMRKHQLCLPWTHQAENEWVPLQIIRSDPGRDFQDRPGAFMDFRVLAGTPCPLVITSFWTRRFLSVIARHFGFTQQRGTYPFKHDEELVGMRCLGHVTVELSVGKPGFRDVRLPNSMLEFNRALLRDRTRPPGGFVCPHNYRHPCVQCPIGYRDCPVSMHPASYEAAYCQNCHKQSWFDPGRPTNLCVQCSRGVAMQSRLKTETRRESS